MSAYIRKGLIKGSPSNPKDRPQNSPSEKNTTDATTASTGTEKNQDTAGNKRKRNVRDAQATTGERVAGTNIGNGDVRPNVLPPKFRKDLETKLRAIPDEKKAAFYDRAKTILATQIEKAKAAGNSKLTRKLEAVQSIIEDTLGQTAQEDGAILNSIFTDTTAAQ